MKVGDLKWILRNVPDDYEVVLAKDSEGNYFSPTVEVQLGRYSPDSTYSGEWCGESEVGNEDYDQPQENAVKAICIWPVN